MDLESHNSSNPVPLPDLYFDSISYPVASIVFGDMVIVLLLLSGKVQSRSIIQGAIARVISNQTSAKLEADLKLRAQLLPEHVRHEV